MTKRRTMTIAGLSVAAVITGGALTAAALPSVAEPSPSASSETTPADPSESGHEANGVTEELLTGDTADQVEAAVLAEYPDVTIQRLETDAEGTYEAHVVQADGTRATVKLDDTFAVTGTETGRQGGGHRGGGSEEELTGDTADQVEAAVLAEYPDATIQRLETDAEGTYEAHIVQADGTRATVKLDDAFAVTGLETGRQGGGHRGGTDTDSDTDESTSGT